MNEVNEVISQPRLILESKARKIFDKETCSNSIKSTVIFMFAFMAIDGFLRASGAYGNIYSINHRLVFICVSLVGASLFIFLRQKIKNPGNWRIAISEDRFWINPRSIFARKVSDKTHAVIEIPSTEIMNLAIIKMGQASWFVVELKNSLPERIVELVKTEQKIANSSFPKIIPINLANDNKAVFIYWRNGLQFYCALDRAWEKVKVLQHYPTDKKVEPYVLKEFTRTNEFLKRFKKDIAFDYDILKLQK